MSNKALFYHSHFLRKLACLLLLDFLVLRNFSGWSCVYAPNTIPDLVINVEILRSIEPTKSLVSAEMQAAEPLSLGQVGADEEKCRCNKPSIL